MIVQHLGTNKYIFRWFPVTPTCSDLGTVSSSVYSGYLLSTYSFGIRILSAMKYGVRPFFDVDYIVSPLLELWYMYCRLSLISACAYEFKWQASMCLITLHHFTLVSVTMETRVKYKIMFIFSTSPFGYYW